MVVLLWPMMPYCASGMAMAATSIGARNALRHRRRCNEIDESMSIHSYEYGLPKTPANFQPLTPLTFLERAAAVFPEHTAVIHGALRCNYRDFYARARRLASALAQRGVGKGDTVSVMLANTPAMLECHYGIPMTNA